MHIIKSLHTPLISEPLSVVIGNFDGIHLGHAEIIKRAKEKNKGKVAVVTFSPHPRHFLAPSFSPQMITTEQEKISILSQLGVDYYVSIPFEDVVNLPPVEFLTLLTKKLPIHAITVGFNFYFGKDQRGNPDILLWWSKGTDIEVEIVPPVIIQGIRVSSTVIRQIIMNGELENAASLLSYPFSISGQVKKGKQLGKKLGFPTLNISPPEKLFPPDGVYVTALHYDNTRFYGVTNIGYNPTIDKDSGKRTIETFIPERTLPDLYDQQITICFLKRIRKEIKFSSREKLIDRINIDISAMRDYVKTLDSKELPSIIPMP